MAKEFYYAMKRGSMQIRCEYNNVNLISKYKGS